MLGIGNPIHTRGPIHSQRTYSCLICLQKYIIESYGSRATKQQKQFASILKKHKLE